jgi:phage gp29-like protein
MAKPIWAPAARIDSEKKDLSDTPDVNISGGDHFATRERANDFARLMRALPDTDPILKKMGRGITALQELLTDSHLESVWGVRCSAASGAEWFMAPAENGGGREQEAADAFAGELKGMDVPRIIEEMMDAVTYGFSPLEVIWTPKDGRWGFFNIVGKPPQWFEFNQDNRLVLKTGAVATEELPENRFLIVQHRPSYANPYGVKVFSKCFWPVTFKKNGFRWWTVFVEKYGGAFMYGKYPANASEQHKADLLSALEKMAADAVAVAPEGSEITIASAADKGGSSNVHSAYIQMANAEISKAVLGETLTTEIGDTGSYAAAETHNDVREDIAAADRRRISAAFNRLAAVYTFYNFGPDVDPPLFQFVQDEDLQLERAKRDAEISSSKVRFTRQYYMREYGFQEDDFEVQEEPGGDSFPGFGNVDPFQKHPKACSCGCQDVNKKRSPFRRFLKIFTSKEEKEKEKTGRLMREFADSQLAAGQREIDKTIELIADALGRVETYEEASAAIAEAMKQHDSSEFAHRMDEIRYVAQMLGEKNG